MVSADMEKSFKVLATQMTELKMNGVEKLDPTNPRLKELLGCIYLIYTWNCIANSVWDSVVGDVFKAQTVDVIIYKCNI